MNSEGESKDMNPDELLRTLGVPSDVIARSHKLDADLIAPTEADVASVVWAVDLSIKDDRMIPSGPEMLNGILVPRPSAPTEDGQHYALKPSRVKRDTQPLWLSLEDAKAARARYLLWHGYYVRAYAAGRLSPIEKDAARRLYWGGCEPPPDFERLTVEYQIDRALREKIGGGFSGVVKVK